MDASISPKDEIWFLRVRHHISAGLYTVSSSVFDVELHLFVRQTGVLAG
jgi:UDP-N-acetyl-D-mannosaminuronic acid transferase (WecB/TagA/CpsF family)